MKVLITGANGLLAANTIRELNHRGIPVRGLVRKTSNLLSLEDAQFEKVYGNIINYEDVYDAADGCNVIIHAAANTGQKPSDQKSDDDLIAIRNMIKVVELQKISRLIFVSSANTFGYGSLESPGNEKTPISEIFQQSLYAKKKLKAQELVIKAARHGNIDALVVNPTFLIGPYDAKPSSGRSILMYMNNRVAFYPPGGKNFVATKDAAVAICNAITKGKSGECYLLAGENLSYKQFYEKVKIVTGIDKPLIPIPLYLLKAMGFGGSFLNRFGFAFELTKENACILSIHNYYSSKKAQNELEMPKSNIELAIDEAYQWFLLNDYLKIQKPSLQPL